jgi:hypothetical protein
MKTECLFALPLKADNENLAENLQTEPINLQRDINRNQNFSETSF